MLKLMETCFLPTKQILIIAKEQKMWVTGYPNDTLLKLKQFLLLIRMKGYRSCNFEKNELVQFLL